MCICGILYFKLNKKKLARSFKFTFHYIDGVLSLTNSGFVDCVDHIYHIELEIKDTTDTHMSASYTSFTNLWSLLLYLQSLLHYIENAQEKKKNIILSYNIAENSKRVK
jgi:hypothetical protein